MYYCMTTAARLALLVATAHICMCQIVHDGHRNHYTRKRRYLNFPYGSTAVLQISMSVGLLWELTNSPLPRWNSIMALDLGFRLPNNTAIAFASRPNSRNYHNRLHRRERRALYRSFEELFDMHGVDGRHCMQRILCESKVSIRPGRSLLEDLLHIIFRMAGWHLVLLTLIVMGAETLSDEENVKKLARRRRYIVFPEGASFSIAFCVTWRLLYERTDIFTMAVNWAVSYELPNETLHHQHSVPSVLVRRHQRELYQQLEVAMNASGLDGRECIKRTLCEAAQRFTQKATMIEEILRIIFSLSMETPDDYETPEHQIYKLAYRDGLTKRSCIDSYRECPFSLLDVLLISPL